MAVLTVCGSALLSACELSSVPAPKEPVPSTGPTPTMAAPLDSTVLPQPTSTIAVLPRPRSSLEQPQRMKWRFVQAGVIVGTAAVGNGLVYFSDQDGNIFGLDSQTGQPRWQSNVVGSMTGTTVLAGSLVVVSANSVEMEGVRGGLVAVDAKTGDGVWSYPIGGEALTSPAFSDGLFYFGGSDSHLYAVDASTGKEKWRAKLDAPVNLDPVEESGVVYTGDRRGNLYAVDATNGQVKWKSSFKSDLLTSPAVADGTVYVGVIVEGRVYALDAATGKVRREFKDVPPTDPPYVQPGYKADYLVTGPPSVADGVVYVGISFGQIGGDAPDRRGYVYALDAASGKQRWEFVAESEVRTPPLAVGKAVYFAAQHGLLYAVDARSGQELWQFEVDAPISASPVAADNTLYFGTWADGFYALKLAEIFAQR